MINLEIPEHTPNMPKRSDLVNAVRGGLIPEDFLRYGVGTTDYLNCYVPTLNNIDALTDPDMIQLAPGARTNLAPQLLVPSYSAYLSRQIDAFNAIEGNGQKVEPVGRAVLQNLFVTENSVGEQLDQIAGSARRLSRDPSVRETPQSEGVIKRVVSILAKALSIAHGEEAAKNMLNERGLIPYVRLGIKR